MFSISLVTAAAVRLALRPTAQSPICKNASALACDLRRGVRAPPVSEVSVFIFSASRFPDKLCLLGRPLWRVSSRPAGCISYVLDFSNLKIFLVEQKLRFNAATSVFSLVLSVFFNCKLYLFILAFSNDVHDSRYLLIVIVF